MISGCVVSRALPFFVEGFHRRLKCGYVYNETAPTFFVGIYSLFDMNKVMNHGSLAVVVFCGSDALLLGSRAWFNDALVKRMNQKIREGKLRLVSISDDVKDALQSLNLPSERYNVCPTREDMYSVTLPKSKRVYVYYNEKHKAIFDWKVYNDVAEHFKGSEVEVLEDRPFVNPLDMAEFYSSCMIGMKPYLFDGYGNTQVELALSGRRCISNGIFSGNLRYKSSQDAISHIEAELKNVNDIEARHELRTLAVNDLVLPMDFNKVEFWV